MNKAVAKCCSDDLTMALRGITRKLTECFELRTFFYPIKLATFTDDEAAKMERNQVRQSGRKPDHKKPYPFLLRGTDLDLDNDAGFSDLH